MAKSLFISPHNDDETLFGAFTILRESPDVLIVYDSFLQVARGNHACDWETRRRETRAAMQILEVSRVEFMGVRDDSPLVDVESLAKLFQSGSAPHGYDHVFAPAFEDRGHIHHNRVAAAAALSFDGRLTRYLTYTDRGRSTSRDRVPIPRDGARKKLLALSCYATQLNEPSTQPHFLRDLQEYYAHD